MNAIDAPVEVARPGGLIVVASQLEPSSISEQEFSFSLSLSPDTRPVQVTAAHNAESLYWRLSASDSQRLVLVYKLAGFPVAVRVACETAHACGQPFSLVLTPYEYHWTFRADPVVSFAVKSEQTGEHAGLSPELASF